MGEHKDEMVPDKTTVNSHCKHAKYPGESEVKVSLPVRVKGYNLLI